MKKKKPPFTKYPGNEWLAERLGKAESNATIPFVHGFVRGALANPYSVDPVMAMGKAFAGVDFKNLAAKHFEELSLAFLHLWNDTAGSLSTSRPLPQALSSENRTDMDEATLLVEAADLAEGFVQGFNLKKPPKGKRLPCARSWIRDVEGEGDWCRMMYENPETLEEELPDPENRRRSITDALCWIEECMRWTVFYARADVDGSARPGPGSGSLARKSPCPCGSGRKYKRCCRKKR